MTEHWTLILTVAMTIFFGVTAALEVYHRLWIPHSQRKAVERESRERLLFSCKDTLQKVIESLTLDTRLGFAPATLQQLQEFGKDARMPTPLREKLQEIGESAIYYDKCIREAKDIIIGTLIEVETLRKTTLNERWARFGIEALKTNLKDMATIPILEGNLNTAQVKESLLEKHGRDLKIDLMDKPGGVITERIRLKDLLDSQAFYELMDGLNRIQSLQFVEYTRTLRGGFIDEVQTAVKWIESSLSK